MRPERSVAELMNPNVVCARPDMTIGEVQRLLADRGVSGAPVVDSGGRVLGVVSQNDLIRLQSERPTVRQTGRFFSDVDDYRDLESIPAELSSVLVEKVMNDAVFAVDRHTTAAEAARTMRAHRIHRLLVTRGDVLVGVVTSMDLLRVVAEGP